MSRVLIFILAIVIGLAAEALAVNLIGRSCEPQQNETTQPKDTNASQQTNAPANAAPIVNAAKSPPAEPDTSPKNEGRNQELWWHNFRCGATVTDSAIVFFTYCLIVVGVAAIRSSERTVRDLERAYLSSSGPLIIGEADRGFKFEVSNNGKTPGTLLEFCIEFRPITEIALAPKYLDPDYARTPYRREFYAGERDVQLARPPVPASIRDPVVYGRIWYLDIWGKPHTWGFLLRIGDGGTSGYFPEADIHPYYHYWN